MRKSFGQPVFKTEREGKVDYDRYELSFREILWVLIKSAVLTGAFTYVFYRSWIGLSMFPLTVWLMFRRDCREAVRKRKERLAVQFKDMVLAALSCMQAGYSVENAFLEAAVEIGNLHGKDCEMAQEMDWVKKGIGNGIALEQMLEGLGKRSHLEEVRDFTESFALARRQGGNLKEMVRRTAELTGQRMEVEREIQTLLASKKYEQKVMNAVPFVLFFYLQLTSEGFFDILYQNTVGVLVMTLCLGIYLAAVFWAEHIVNAITV